MTRNSKQWMAAFLMTAVMASACSGGGGPAAGGKVPDPQGSASTRPGEGSGKEAPAKMTMFNMFDGNEAPNNNSDIMKQIREYTNTDFQINWVPANNYTEKVNALLASGDLPMVMAINNHQTPTVINAIRSGGFWEIESYLDEYPNLSKINKQVLDNLRVDNNVYSIPKTRPVVKDGIIYREDWAKNLGLGQPKNLDELYRMIKAFTLNDPDRNGKDDTIGLVDLKGLNRFNYLVTAVGGGNEWDVRDGRVIPNILIPEYMEVLKFYRKLYGEKLMNQDFAVIELAQTWEAINKNKAGVLISDPEQITYFGELVKMVPTAEMGTFADLESPKGVRMPLNKGHNGSYFIPKSAVKTEAELRRVLKFLDQLCDDNIQNLFVWGIENVHYSLKDGKPSRTPEQNDLYQKDIYRIERGMRIRDIEEAMQGHLSPAEAKYKQVMKDMADKLVGNPVISFVSDTYAQKGGDLDTIWRDARTKFIIGQIDEAGWNEAIQKWRSSGGDKVIEEMNEQYAAKK